MILNTIRQGTKIYINQIIWGKNHADKILFYAQDNGYKNNNGLCWSYSLYLYILLPDMMDFKN